MNNYLDTLLEKAIHPGHGVQPRPISMFEPFQDRSDTPVPDPLTRLPAGGPEIPFEDGGSTSGNILSGSVQSAGGGRFPHGSGSSQPRPGSEINDVHGFEEELIPMPRNQGGRPGSQVGEADPEDRGPLEPIRPPTHSERRVTPKGDLVRADPVQPLETGSMTAERQDSPQKVIGESLPIQDQKSGTQPVVQPALRAIQQEPDHPHREEHLPGISEPGPSASLFDRPVLDAAISPGPTIHVTIGRVEVRAARTVPAPRPVQRKTAIGLDDYLQQRQGGKS